MHEIKNYTVFYQNIKFNHLNYVLKQTENQIKYRNKILFPVTTYVISVTYC